MKPIEVFELYNGVKTHFVNDKYDFFKYNGKTTNGVKQYNKNSSIYFFEQFSEHYSKEELIYLFYFFISRNPSVHISEIYKHKGSSEFKKWKARVFNNFEKFISDSKQELTFFGKQCFYKSMQKKEGIYPDILTYIDTKIDFEFLCIICMVFTNYDKYLEKNYDDIFINNYLKRVNKSISFIQFFLKNKLDKHFIKQILG